MHIIKINKKGYLKENVFLTTNKNLPEETKMKLHGLTAVVSYMD